MVCASVSALLVLVVFFMVLVDAVVGAGDCGGGVRVFRRACLGYPTSPGRVNGVGQNQSVKREQGRRTSGLQLPEVHLRVVRFRKVGRGDEKGRRTTAYAEVLEAISGPQNARGICNPSKAPTVIPILRQFSPP